MKRIIVAGIFLFLFSFSMPLNAQWAKSYGGSGDDTAYSIQQTSDGGYIVAGETASFGTAGFDIWILKLSLAGEIEWQRTYGGNGSEAAHCIQQTSDGGYIVAGYTDSFVDEISDIWILKLSSEGDIEWQRTYGGSGRDVAHSIQQTGDGGYIVAGYTSSSGIRLYDFWVLKLSSNGYFEWQRTYGGNGDDRAYSIQQTSDEGYVVAGHTDSFGTGESDFWIFKLSSRGYIDWDYTYRGIGNDVPNSIQETGDGGYIVAGYTASSGAGGLDFWVLKLSSDGFIDWERTYGGSGDDVAHSIQETSDGGYIVAGYTGSFGTGELDSWIIKLVSNGDIDWEYAYGGSEVEWNASIQETSDGGYIAASCTNSYGAGEPDFLILRLSPNGDIAPSCELTQRSNATVLVTSAIQTYTNIRPQDTSFAPQYTSISPQESDATVNIICEARPTISGAVKNEAGDGIEGVAITFSDEGGTATTDSEGNYSFTVSYGWSGTATPSKAGYAFLPPSRSYTDVTSDQTDQDYTAGLAYIISGSVKDDEDAGIEGVTITFSNEGGTTTTDSNGSYFHTVIEGWSGTATPSKTCYSFIPPSRNYTNVTSDLTGQDYTGILPTISGTVLVAETSAPLNGVVINGLPGNPETDASGYYEATVDCGWSGTAIPNKLGYTFDPRGRTYSNVTSNKSNQDYSADPGWIITGLVRTGEGEGISGVTIAFSNEGGSTTTGSDGSYSHTVKDSWSGTATPNKVGYTFDPSYRTYSNVTSDLPNQDYTGTPIPRHTLEIIADVGGTTWPSPGKYVYYEGTQVAIEAIPNSGYIFSGWSGDASGTANRITITMDSDKYITANFSEEEKGLCFIATAAYGTPFHPHVRILRDFRDKYLLPNKLGRYLVYLYYKYSPSVAELTAKYKALKVAVRFGLLPLVIFSYAILHFGPIISGIMFISIFGLPIFPFLLYRRRTRRAARKNRSRK